MKIAILNTTHESLNIEKSQIIDAHKRNAVQITKYLDAEYIFSKTDYKKALGKKYDIIIVDYCTRFSPYDNIHHIIMNNNEAEIYWLTNEYDIRNPFKENKLFEANIKINVITNVLNKDIYNSKIFNKVFEINLNLLLAKKANELTPKKYNCIYYGTFRPNRAKYFKEYLKENIYLSSSIKNFKKFKHIGCNPKYIGKLNWNNKQETLNNFRYSLYIEDVYTHTNYNHLANRFYESLFCNIVQFFDINTKNTIEKSGIVFDDYFYVSNYNELMQKINETNENDNWQKAMNFQSQWNIQALEQKEQMINELKNIIGIKNGI